MNREQRRKTIRKLQKRGIKKSAAGAFIKTKEAISNASELFLQEGQKVRLNVEALKLNLDWSLKTPKYREWVEAHADDIFTVKYDAQYDAQRKMNPTIVTLAEDEIGWLWFEGHLIKVDD